MITVFLAGDSTVAYNSIDTFPQAGWGQMLGRFFNENVIIDNHAANGRSSKSFIDEGRLENILKKIKKDDFLFIQFGHNDEKEDFARRTDAFTTYKKYLTRYIEGARAVEATPILITSVNRRRFTDEGKIIDTHGEYIKAVRELSKELSVKLIDLFDMSKNLFEELGCEKTKEIFLWLPENKYEHFKDGVEDNTHFCENGAIILAKLVAEEIYRQRIEPLCDNIKIDL